MVTSGFSAPVSPPPIPTIAVDEGGQSGAEPSLQPLDQALIATAWQEVEEVAKAGKWTPWVRVIDTSTGRVVLAANDGSAHTPASTMKILTTFFALSMLDPAQTLKTGVSLAGSDLFLWGEGDLLLTAGAGDAGAVNGRAGLDDLAEQAAAALKQAAVTEVSLSYQEALFEGPLRPPGWVEQEVTDFGGDVTAFAIDTGRTYPGAWEFVADSAKSVADSFADSLQSRGIKVTSVSPGLQPSTATWIASVESATVLDQIEFMAITSDNTLAEQYCHLAASSYLGTSASLAESVAALSSFLSESPVDSEKLKAYDCSGLDSRTKVKAQTLTDTIMNSTEQGAISLTRFFPVGGVNGTLSERFQEGSASGNVTAKTGSLGSVASLAGLVTTESGHTLVFAVGADEVPDFGAAWYRSYLDDFVTALAES
ncbi:D-alanyl-D-alanine carboxypeptidase [Actinomyces minihominis]|uniref:D-alanyl-D-alanine carboxypeptidase n=1 Tax=Actinomyces minihominis TaxID=2002838 RepID=UPI0013EE1B09|nr:D-alanyl-D-alanine carboxypeptidase [Actinomyces minihominis]